MRVVTKADDWPYKYRCYVYESKTPFTRRPGWRYAVEECWASIWRYKSHSRWFPTKEEAQFSADKWLDYISTDKREFV